MVERDTLDAYTPKLRALDLRWVVQGGQRYIHLRDPLGLNGQELMVPEPLVPFLGLCDGTRDIPSLRTASMITNGFAPSLEEIEAIIGRLDDALLLEGPRFEEQKRRALDEYRSAPFRTSALAGPSYPDRPEELESTLDGYLAQAPRGTDSGPCGTIVGLISPHIDYQRGNRVYAQTWGPIADAVRNSKLVIVLGTDHSGGSGSITLTRQNYATPWGALPTHFGIVDDLIQRLGESDSLREELHHVKEHSIELALVWLHYMLDPERRSGSDLPEIVPILTGHMWPFLNGEQDPGDDDRYGRLIDGLREATGDKDTLIVVAGDLAHVGPAFGDTVPWDADARARLRTQDHESLESIGNGDADGFFQGLKHEQDSRRVCGMTPIYLALRLLGPEVSGEIVGYDQCPADAEGGSLVSIAGVIWRQPHSNSAAQPTL